MSLTEPRVTQINTSDIASTAFASKTSVNAVQANLTSFASYANSTFSSGGGGGSASGNGVVFSDSFITSNVTTNQFSLSANVSYGQNLLVYLNGLLQHPDAYVVSANSLTLINTEPLPSGLKIGVRELSVAGGVANAALANTSEARAANSANGTLTFDYQGANLYVYDGVVEGGYYLSLTQAVIPAPAYSFQGSVSGYSSGGSPSEKNVIEKFSFSADGNSTDVGDLTLGRRGLAGQSSSENGYSSGGAAPSNSNVIDKFPFAVDGNATDVGDLTQSRQQVAGQSSTTSGYTSGGGLGAINIIDKFSFSADGNATDVGDLTQGRYGMGGQSSSENGYSSGGTAPVNIVDKFPFATDANATDTGDLTVSRGHSAGQSSETSGYTSGGFAPAPTYFNVIDKFPFASNANATDVGDLTQARNKTTGHSSTLSGYTSGGEVAPGALNIIDKFPFAADANATDVGDLTAVKAHSAGQQI
jgi:hypothetical protein